MARSKRLYSASRNVISACLGVGESWGYTLQRTKGMPNTSVVDAVSWYVTTIKSAQTAARRGILSKELALKNNVFKKVDSKIAKGENVTPATAKKLVDKALEKHFKSGDSVSFKAPDVDKIAAELSRPGKPVGDEGPFEVRPMDLAEQLEKTKEEAGYCHAMMVRNRENPPLYDYWKKAFDKSFKQTFEVERDIMKIQLEAGKVIPLELLDEQMLSFAKKLIQHIDRIPQRVSKKFSGKQKIDILEAWKVEANHLKSTLYEFTSSSGQ